MTVIQHYLKLCAAWATALWERSANKLLKTIYAREILESQKLFIGNVAHELRTPLSTIKTSSEVALLDPALPEDARASFVEIIGELERISEILNNLLSLGALSRPEEMHFKNLDLLPIAERVALRHKMLAKQRRIRLTLKLTPRSIAWANGAAIEQILMNLLKNALLFTPPQSSGRVELAIYPENEAVVIRVRDSGIGMSQDDLAHIFEPFYRADASRTRITNKKVGSGLGLTIVNQLVRAHRGKIHIESRRKYGTTVHVRVPRGGAYGAARASADFSSAERVDANPAKQQRQ